MKTRTGKIARLPKQIREELNRRLEEGEPGRQLVEWLNTVPEVKTVLAAEFSGQPINEQNLTAWRQGGYREWVFRQDTLGRACDLSDLAYEIEDTVGDSLADELATVLVARYAALLAGWDGESRDGFHRDLRALRELTHDVVQLRRGAHSATRLRVERERWEAAQKETDGTQRAAAQMLPLQLMLLATAAGDLYERKARECGQAPSEMLAFLSGHTPEQLRNAGATPEIIQWLGLRPDQGESR